MLAGGGREERARSGKCGGVRAGDAAASAAGPGAPRRGAGPANAWLRDEEANTSVASVPRSSLTVLP